MRPTLMFMSDEKRRARPAIQYGPTAATVADNVKRLRDRRSMTIYELSGALGAAGRPITPSAIAKIERRQRQVTVDDLLALAVVFGVSPAALLLPLEDRANYSVEITGIGTVAADDAWDWIQAQRPLKTTPGAEQRELLEFQLYGLPSGRHTPAHPAARALEAVRDDLLQLMRRTGYVSEGDDAEFRDLLDMARTSLNRASAELDRIERQRVSEVRALNAYEPDDGDGD